MGGWENYKGKKTLVKITIYKKNDFHTFSNL